MNLYMPQKQQSDMLGYPLVDKENEPPHFESITRHMTTKVNWVPTKARNACG